MRVIPARSFAKVLQLYWLNFAAASQEHQQYYPYAAHGRNFAEGVSWAWQVLNANDNRFTPFGIWGLILVAERFIDPMSRGIFGQLTSDIWHGYWINQGLTLVAKSRVLIVGIIILVLFAYLFVNSFLIHLNNWLGYIFIININAHILLAFGHHIDSLSNISKQLIYWLMPARCKMCENAWYIFTDFLFKIFTRVSLLSPCWQGPVANKRMSGVLQTWNPCV